MSGRKMPLDETRSNTIESKKGRIKNKDHANFATKTNLSITLQISTAFFGRVSYISSHKNKLSFTIHHVGKQSKTKSTHHRLADRGAMR